MSLGDELRYLRAFHGGHDLNQLFGRKRAGTPTTRCVTQHIDHGPLQYGLWLSDLDGD